ncbi:MAG: virulence factor TspB C-terminal domain-related protein [Methylomonas sp.]|nr:virulence factor TspB C-terminal domain-related protein [Methylomonas sp.]
MIRDIAIFILLTVLSQCVSAVPIIFKTNKSVLVRTPSGVVAKPGIGELLSTVPVSGGAKAGGQFPVSIGSASAQIPVSKTYPSAAIAASLADALLSKTAVGAVATLALPYLYDQITDELMKQQPAPVSAPVHPPLQPMPSQSPPTGNYCISGAYCDGSAGGTCTKLKDALNTARKWTKYFVQSSSQFQCVVSQTDATWWTATYDITLTNAQCGTTGDLNTTTRQCTKLECTDPAYTLDYTDQMCYYTDGTCTSPSSYDSSTGMCLGSAFNEPANRQQLEQDINDTFSSDPSKTKPALDALFDSNIEPDGATQAIDDFSPKSIPGQSTTEQRQFNDPTTGNPSTETTTKQQTNEITKAGPDTVNVEVVENITTNITDNVTNTTVTTTTTINEAPTESTTPSEPEPTKSECELHPDSIGCSKYGDIPVKEVIPTKNQPIMITPEFSPVGSCPAPQTIETSRGTFSLSWQPECDFATKIKPLVIAVAWLIAGGMVIVSARRA